MTRAAVEHVLRAVRDVSQDKRIILIGGQAVAWWVNFFEHEVGAEFVARATTSKDIDFKGTTSAARDVARALRGRIRIPPLDDATPNTAVVAYVDIDGVDREIDFLAAPLGVRDEDVDATAVLVELTTTEVDEAIPVWVMHPERCLESRVANVMVLGTRDDLAIGQLEASIVVTRQFSRLLLAQGHRRDVLKLNERIFRKCRDDRNFRALHAALGIDAFGAVCVDDRLGEFVGRRYPQMQRQLEARREVRPA